MIYCLDYVNVSKICFFAVVDVRDDGYVARQSPTTQDVVFFSFSLLMLLER